MGLDISESKEVSLNKNHEKRLVTSSTRNPKLVVKNDLHIHCIYQRTKRGDSRDGNPFIYALKGIHGYSISKYELSCFRESFYSILEKVPYPSGIDYIIPMPSSHPIASFLSKRIKNNSVYMEDFFQKKTISEVLKDFDGKVISKSHRKEVNNQLSKFSKNRNKNEEISLKHMPAKIREYFPPIKINPKYEGSHLRGGVLLVDDLLSTGTTLMAAQNELLKASATAVGAICLLSDLGK